MQSFKIDIMCERCHNTMNIKTIATETDESGLTYVVEPCEECLEDQYREGFDDAGEP